LKLLLHRIYVQGGPAEVKPTYVLLVTFGAWMCR